MTTQIGYRFDTMLHGALLDCALSMPRGAEMPSLFEGGFVVHLSTEQFGVAPEWSHLLVTANPDVLLDECAEDGDDLSALYEAIDSTLRRNVRTALAIEGLDSCENEHIDSTSLNRQFPGLEFVALRSHETAS
jgi:hypothetical protein